MAIGWWLETGIYSKMAEDVGQNQIWTTAWTQPSTHEKETLKLSHILPLFIIFGASIVLSITTFGLEVFHQRIRQHCKSITDPDLIPDGDAECRTGNARLFWIQEIWPH